LTCSDLAASSYGQKLAGLKSNLRSFRLPSGTSLFFSKSKI